MLIGISGKSGSGKSTVAHYLGGHLNPYYWRLSFGSALKTFGIFAASCEEMKAWVDERMRA